MPNSTGLEKIKLFPEQDVRTIANTHLGVFYKRVAQYGLDYQGQKFPPYSEAYEKLLVKNFRKKDGSRYKGFEQIAISSGQEKIARRQLVLRGLTMKNLRLRRVGKDFYVIGWDGEAASIIDGNAGKGRDVMSGIPQKESDFVAKQFTHSIDKQAAKLKNIKIRVGK